MYFIKQGGIEELSISGGEPFLHPDLFEMVKFCKDNGISISDEEIENPQNPANLINTKLIIYHY